MAADWVCLWFSTVLFRHIAWFYLHLDHCCFDYILITNLMHWLLFIHKILFSSTCFEPQVLIYRRIQLYTCSIWYCHSLWEFLVACRYTAWVYVYRQATRNSHREWQYHMLHIYNCILLKMSTWGSKHVEESSILWINNNQCIKLVINVYSIHDARSEKHQVSAASFHFDTNSPLTAGPVIQHFIVQLQINLKQTRARVCVLLAVGTHFGWSW